MKKKLKKKILIIFLILLINPFPVSAMIKTETIYSTLKYNGEVKTTKINTELRNITEGEVVDYTYLSEIKNINGKESFTKDSEKLTWKSTGKDIYYQGTTSTKLPVEVKVTYYLNGKETTPEKMKDKKGSVKIVFMFTNNEYNQSTGMYVPYIISTTALLNNKTNTNISITSGKTFSTGKKTVVTAISSPGLYKSTGIEELKELDQFSITFQTSKFENIDFYMIVTPKLLEQIDLKNLEQVDELTYQLGELQNGMNQIEDGSKKLTDANNSISEKVKKFSESLGTISEGANTINENIQGINQTINDIANTVDLLNALLSNESGNVYSLTEDQYNLLPENVRNYLEQMLELYVTNENILISLKELNASLEATYDLYGLSQDEATLRIEFSKNDLDERTIALLLNTKKIYETNYDSNEALINVIKENLKDILSGETGILTIISNYLNILRERSNALADGTAQIATGLDELYNGSIQLSEGVSQIADSTSSLSDGISKINAEGISKISSLGTEVNNYSTKAKTLVNMSKNYNGFAAENVDQTIFIFKLSTN